MAGFILFEIKKKVSEALTAERAFMRRKTPISKSLQINAINPH